MRDPDPSPSETPEATAGERGPRRARVSSTAVRRALLDSAAALFAERGYGGTNLRDVADALRMSRTGLYHHFPSKEKILEAIVEEVTLSSERQLNDMVANERDDPEAALRMLVRATTIWVLDHHTMFRVLDRSDADLSPDLRRSNERSKKAIQNRFVTLIESGIEEGRFRPVDAHVAALTISGMRNWAAWWYRDDGRLSKEAIADIVADMAVQSLVRIDAHRSRSGRIDEVIRILEEDISHLKRLLSASNIGSKAIDRSVRHASDPSK